jgi:hypothetical protein
VVAPGEAKVARYAIPTAGAEGVIELDVVGFSEVMPRGGSPSTHALHIRLMAQVPSGAGPFILDTRNLVLSIPGESWSRPAFVRSSLGVPPRLELPSGQTVTIDLYYGRPAGADEDELPLFSLAWRVATPLGDLSQRTRFDRIALEPPEARFVAGFDLGGYPYWYYDPFFPQHTFIRRPFLRQHAMRLARRRGPRSR